MNKTLKRLLLLFPIVVLVMGFAYLKYQDSRLDHSLKEANNLTFGAGNNLLTVQVSRSIENEVTTDVINVTNIHGGPVLQAVAVMDHDLYGTGFIKAMQVDSDAELEVVAWGNNIRNGESFFLDFVDDHVQRRPFDEVSDHARDLVQDYVWLNTVAPVWFIFLIAAAFFYYLLYLIITASIKARANKKQKKVP